MVLHVITLHHTALQHTPCNKSHYETTHLHLCICRGIANAVHPEEGHTNTSRRSKSARPPRARNGRGRHQRWHRTRLPLHNARWSTQDGNACARPARRVGAWTEAAPQCLQRQGARCDPCVSLEKCATRNGRHGSPGPNIPVCIYRDMNECTCLYIHICVRTYMRSMGI